MKMPRKVPSTWHRAYAEGFALGVEILAREGNDQQALTLLPHVQVELLGSESREQLVEALDKSGVRHEIRR